MALLNRSRVFTPRRIVGGLLLIAGAGCMFVGGGEAHAKLAFNHAKHVLAQNLECINCHADAGRLDQPGMPSTDACSVCHDEIDTEKPPEQRIATLFDGDVYRASHAARVSGEIVFSHKRHTGSNACNACHRGIESNERIVPSMHLAMADCTSCHARRSVVAAHVETPDTSVVAERPEPSVHAAASGPSFSGAFADKSECALCHREIRANVAPVTHQQNWKRLHGLCVRSRSDATVDKCALCHSDSTCVQCHREEAPDNHNEFFRLRGHGLTAMLDRQTCAACHEPASCSRCHSESPPRNHIATWGSTRDTHCLSCHFPLRADGCAACHPNTHSHLEAPPKPTDPFHVRGLNCRQCHGLTAVLLHVDNGDDCNACHH